ncbi:Hypothetical_protein [Hexamita inflata]|uniref:Hypothetical_protein n=1 Tax=Hexamita inflata TaxID=28002 RepID=A0AA86V5R1_9EUKA|nr:Hypothetical protein HINF_LOCUS64952 [Hexamita inflata]
MAHRNQCQKIFMIVSSPIWVPLSAIILGIFVPIQFLLNSCRIKQFQRQRRKQLLSAQNVLINNNPQVNDQLQDQLIFKFKPIHYIDIEMQITQTQIQLASNNIILYSQPVPFDLQSKYFNVFCNYIDDSRFMQAKVVGKELQLPRAQFNPPVVCYGKIFLNIFDFIFTIEDFNLKYFAQISKYALGSINNDCGKQLFKINSKLYCHNKSGQFFEIKPSGRLKCVKLKFVNQIKQNNAQIDKYSTNNQYDSNFTFNLKLKSCQLFLSHKLKTSLAQTQNKVRSKFEIVNNFILTIANQHRTISSSIQNTFQEIDQ